MSENGQQQTQPDLQPTPDLRTVAPRGAQRRPLEGNAAPAQAEGAETPQRVGTEPAQASQEPQQAQQTPEQPETGEQAPEPAQQAEAPPKQRKRITAAQRDDALARLRQGEDPAAIAESLGTAEKKIKDLKRRYLDEKKTAESRQQPSSRQAQPQNAGTKGGATVSTSIRAPKKAADAKVLISLVRLSEREGISLEAMRRALDLALEG